MIIEFTKTFTDNEKTYHSRFAYDVKNEDAKRYVEAGVARKSPEPVSEVAPDPIAYPSPLKHGEHEGDDPTKPDAKPIGTPENAAGNTSAVVEPQASVAGAKAAKEQADKEAAKAAKDAADKLAAAAKSEPKTETK